MMIVLDIGVWTSDPCGVRDFAEIFRQRLVDHDVSATGDWAPLDGREGEVVSTVWKWVGSWTSRARTEEPDLMVWHYSVFSYGVRGVPFVAPLVALKLRCTGVPMIVMLHEFAYPWGRRGLKGLVLSVTQRMALVAVVWASRGAVITTEHRLDWMRSRPWLPRRPLLVAPVFSTVPRADKPTEPSGDPVNVVGVFGYGAESADAEIGVDVMTRVLARRPDAKLVLLGAPGADSVAGRRWRAASSRAGCSDAMRFTGRLSKEDLSAEITRTPVFISLDRSGPTSRKTTLAALLDHGSCVIAVDGPERWEAMVSAGAVALVSANDDDLAREVCSFLADSARRAALSRRAEAFSRRSLDPLVVAGDLSAFFHEVAATSSRRGGR